MHLQRSQNTVVQTLLDSPHLFSDAEIHVWVKASPHDDGFHDRLQGYLDELPAEEWFFNAIPANDALQARPGDHLLFLENLPRAGLQVDLLRLPSANPVLSTRHGRFLKAIPTLTFRDMRLGDTASLVAAGRRALAQAGKQAGGQAGGHDWVGGIAEFASRFLRRPTTLTARLKRLAS